MATTLTPEDFVRAILHGWNNCEVRYHMNVIEAYAALDDPTCTDKHCECQDANKIRDLLSGED